MSYQCLERKPLDWDRVNMKQAAKFKPHSEAICYSTCT